MNPLSSHEKENSALLELKQIWREKKIGLPYWDEQGAMSCKKEFPRLYDLILMPWITIVHHVMSAEQKWRFQTAKVIQAQTKRETDLILNYLPKHQELLENTPPSDKQVNPPVETDGHERASNEEYLSALKEIFSQEMTAAYKHLSYAETIYGESDESLKKKIPSLKSVLENAKEKAQVIVLKIFEETTLLACKSQLDNDFLRYFVFSNEHEVNQNLRFLKVVHQLALPFDKLVFCGALGLPYPLSTRNIALHITNKTASTWTAKNGFPIVYANEIISESHHAALQKIDGEFFKTNKREDEFYTKQLNLAASSPEVLGQIIEERNLLQYSYRDLYKQARDLLFCNQQALKLTATYFDYLDELNFCKDKLDRILNEMASFSIEIIKAEEETAPCFLILKTEEAQELQTNVRSSLDCNDHDVARNLLEVRKAYAKKDSLDVQQEIRWSKKYFDAFIDWKNARQEAEEQRVSLFLSFAKLGEHAPLLMESSNLGKSIAKILLRPMHQLAALLQSEKISNDLITQGYIKKLRNALKDPQSFLSYSDNFKFLFEPHALVEIEDLATELTDEQKDNCLSHLRNECKYAFSILNRLAYNSEGIEALKKRQKFLLNLKTSEEVRQDEEKANKKIQEEKVIQAELNKRFSINKTTSTQLQPKKSRSNKKTGRNKKKSEHLIENKVLITPTALPSQALYKQEKILNPIRIVSSRQSVAESLSQLKSKKIHKSEYIKKWMNLEPNPTKILEIFKYKYPNSEQSSPTYLLSQLARHSFAQEIDLLIEMPLELKSKYLIFEEASEETGLFILGSMSSKEGTRYGAFHYLFGWKKFTKKNVSYIYHRYFEYEESLPEYVRKKLNKLKKWEEQDSSFEKQWKVEGISNELNISSSGNLYISDKKNDCKITIFRLHHDLK